MLEFDIVFACDFRMPTDACVGAATKIRAAAAAGLSVAILPLKDGSRFDGGLIDARIQRVVEQFGVDMISAITAARCEILFLEQPYLFTSMPVVSAALRPDAIVCRVDALPPPPGGDVPASLIRASPTARMISSLESMFECPVWLAPTGPLARSALVASGDGSRLLPEDCPTLVDLDEWRRPVLPPQEGETVRAGRHVPTEDNGWPDSAVVHEAYGSGAAHRFALMGLPPSWLEPMYFPTNWEGVAYHEGSVASFLASLHFYIGFAGGGAVGCPLGVVEAMASGVVVLLPIELEPVFGDGAVYATAAEVGSIMARMATNPVAYLSQAMKGRAAVTRHFSVAGYPAYLQRLRAALAGAREATPVPRVPPAPRRHCVLMVSSNGEGIGHLTRLLAIAERLPADVKACFFTLSQAADIVRQRGFPVDIAASHRANRLDDASWNDWLVAELSLACRHFDPDAVVFDGSVPYAGLMDFAKARRDLSWFWVRRGLWREDKRYVTGGHVAFDCVIEPADFCRDEDVGETSYKRQRVFDVDPILLVDPADRLDRAAARKQLDLDPDQTCVAVHLGPDSNAALMSTRADIVARLESEPGVKVVNLYSPLDREIADDTERQASRKLFPLTTYAKAFDLVIGNAGYNNFHECIYGGVPAIFVPKEGPEMDDQLLRARYAEGAGLSLTLRVGDPFSVDQTVRRALSPEFRAQVERRSSRLAFRNGAVAAAEIIAQAARGWRVGLSLADGLARF